MWDRLKDFGVYAILWLSRPIFWFTGVLSDVESEYLELDGYEYDDAPAPPRPYKVIIGDDYNAFETLDELKKYVKGYEE